MNRWMTDDDDGNDDVMMIIIIHLFRMRTGWQYMDDTSSTGAYMDDIAAPLY